MSGCGGTDGRCRPVVVVGKETRRPVRVYRSVSEAAQALGRPRTSIERILRDGGLPEGPLYYRYADEFDVTEDFAGRRRRAVAARPVDGGRGRTFLDAKHAARAYRVEPVTIRKAIATERPRYDAVLDCDVILEWL